MWEAAAEPLCGTHILLIWVAAAESRCGTAPRHPHLSFPHPSRLVWHGRDPWPWSLSALPAHRCLPAPHQLPSTTRPIPPPPIHPTSRPRPVPVPVAYPSRPRPVPIPLRPVPFPSPSRPLPVPVPSPSCAPSHSPRRTHRHRGQPAAWSAVPAPDASPQGWPATSGCHRTRRCEHGIRQRDPSDGIWTIGSGQRDPDRETRSRGSGRRRSDGEVPSSASQLHGPISASHIWIRLRAAHRFRLRPSAIGSGNALTPPAGGFHPFAARSMIDPQTMPVVVRPRPM